MEGGRGMQVSMYTALQGQQDEFFYFKKGIKKQSLINQYRAKTLYKLDEQTSKDKESTIGLK